MNKSADKNSSGILKSIKKLIFEDVDITSNGSATTNQSTHEIKTDLPTVKAQEPTLASNIVDDKPVQFSTDSSKEMKARVLDILEKLNHQGLDFFEVWNAAAEMGSVDVNSIKAAFTSFKYVDKTLTKEKLLTTGRSYANEIQKIIDQDVAQKLRQKEAAEKSLVNERQAINAEIKGLEDKISELQNNLNQLQRNFKELDGKYDKQLKEIDEKISLGKAAVQEVVHDIEKALNIIENNIN